MRVVEFHCGIGGCATALDGAATIVAAVDINLKALALYRHNERGPASAAICRTIESMKAADMAAWGADLWWMSPPCQPHTTRGAMRGLSDPRSDSLVNLLHCLTDIRPKYVAMENVPGFMKSDSRTLWLKTLETCGYSVNEWLMCPSEMGWPAKRPRYFSVAAAHGRPLASMRKSSCSLRLADFLDVSANTTNMDLWRVPEKIISKFGKALHVLDRDDDAAVTRCFTSAYGKSPVGSGSYLRSNDGIRYFTPNEIVSLLGFPDTWKMPLGMTPKELWPLVGNSLAIPCVRAVLSTVPGLMIIE